MRHINILAFAAAVMISAPALALGGGFTSEVLLEPRFWIVAVSCFAMVGLAIGNGIGSKKPAPQAKRYQLQPLYVAASTPAPALAKAA